MAVEQFTKEEFENALPKGRDNINLFDYIGIVKGEHCYAWLIGSPNDNRGRLRIVVRSSIKAGSNKSADTGEDSLRVVIEQHLKGKWTPIGKGSGFYTTRVKGWEKRLRDKIKEVFYLIRKIDQSRLLETRLYRSNKDNQNKGRFYITEPHWKWLTPLEEKNDKAS